MEYFLLFFCLNFTMSGSGGQWRDEKGEEKEEREDWEGGKREQGRGAMAWEQQMHMAARPQHTPSRP